MALDETNAEVLTQQTRTLFESYGKLSGDEKLALLYYLYEAMGESITPAAPTAADPNLAPVLLGDFYNLSHDDQLAVMRQIANGEDSEYSRAYGALTPNNQLMVWFAWAQAMGKSVVDLPGDYQPAQGVTELLDQLKGLDFQEQISVLREIAASMGYSNVQPIPSQAETGKTASL
ncbi:MAG: orange carotenoid protein [Synechococcales cyanobacterium M58_A2018_015]|nr:orange carotenoid protein [Synechococcales cyanobacterium M58_A2018_015]